MRKDRRLNGWVMLASILEIIGGLVLLLAGAFVAVAGYLKPEEMLKIDDLTFFISQEGIFDIQKTLFDGILKTKFLYLSLGIIVAVVGLLALIFAIVALNYAKKRKVVRHRFAMLVFTLIPLAVAGCVATYLVLEFKTLTDNIKYVAYGVVGLFGFIVLCNLLGVIFGRSEKFMSNDNNKYAFDNNALRTARVNVNNNVRDAKYQNANQNPQQRMIQQQIQRTQPTQARPQPVRPNQPINSQASQPVRNARPPMAPSQGVSRPVNPRPGSAMPTRPMQPQRPMPTSSTQQPASAQSKKYCVKCGKMLAPGERFCSLCGYKVKE